MPKQLSESKIWKLLKAIPGGYEYLGVCSMQLCFPLKKGGELRFMYVDDDQDDRPESEKGSLITDHYDGALPPCITGPATATGTKV